MLGLRGAPKSAPGVYPRGIPYWRVLVDHGAVTQEVLDYEFAGSGTEDDPYAVTWIPDDARDPKLFSSLRKLSITLTAAATTLIVSLASSAYSGSIDEVISDFNVSTQVATLGLSLYVLGFAIGPLLWAPVGEVWGRQVTFFFSMFALAAFLAGCAGAQNIWTLCILRFFAGSVGSSPFSNAGGTISDLFTARQRGLALSLYAAAPFLGPSLGPIIGGFLGMKAGWRWVEGLLAATAGFVWILSTLVIPETYPPVLLRRRAETLSKMTGKVYRSKVEIDNGRVRLVDLLNKSLLRPWVLLFKEPIVLLCAVYIAIIYGTLYMFFDAFPVVFQQGRGWNPGVGGLSFLGIMIGMIIGIGWTVPANIHYIKIMDAHGGHAPPEARLIQCMPGAILIPISQFWFAWTDFPSIHWIVSIIGTAPFGTGVILIYLGIMNYLIDSYTIYSASVLASNAVLRSVFGAIFPIISTWMYGNLGIHWAPSIPAFLSVACLPIPFLFYKYGSAIRSKCKYAAESAEYMQRIMAHSLKEKQATANQSEPMKAPQEESNLERATTLH
ncbi:bicyclomycin resistance protein [Penicillium argentinense]|uniref:Bicyclomycin resistance protein n=1 Tax=Penicillium argentinense TaxID=1131581 RepID=A0A9W9K9M6_9EURO|nr:bicyclomycin resistance protein [Penicillium argentinense]KAJ5098085.1 bicyclomycin resistance protein [Penicillium argentinense]